jgi:hypothetical protein
LNVLGLGRFDVEGCAPSAVVASLLGISPGFAKGELGKTNTPSPPPLGISPGFAKGEIRT